MRLVLGVRVVLGRLGELLGDHEEVERELFGNRGLRVKELTRN